MLFSSPIGKILEDKRKNLEESVANRVSGLITANEKQTSCFDIGQPVEESLKKIQTNCLDI